MELIFDYLEPLFVLSGIAVIVGLVYLILSIPDFWKKRQQKLIDKYFEDRDDKKEE